MTPDTDRSGPDQPGTNKEPQPKADADEPVAGEGTVAEGASESGETGGDSERTPASPQKKAGLTPGQRLAAKKAAKANKKAVARGRQAEVVEERVLERAAEAGDWLDRHRRLLLIAGVGACVALAGFLYWNSQKRARLEEAAGKVAAALDTTVEGAEPGTTADGPAMREALEKALGDDALGPLSAWTHLAIGAEALQAGDQAAAKAAFEQALAGAGADAFVTMRAEEGLLYVEEAAESGDAASERLKRLAAGTDATESDLADYHRARLALRRGEREEAKEILNALITRRESEREDAPDLPFTEAQARVRLTELDPTYSDQSMPSFGPGGPGLGNAPAPSGLTGPGGQSLPPEILELLRKQGATPPSP